MVLVGLFCVLGAIGLLVTGLVQADQDLVWASIAASAVGGLAVLAASIQRSRILRRAGPSNRHTGAIPSPSRKVATQAAVRVAEAAPQKAGAAPEPGPPEPDADAVEETVEAEPTVEKATPDEPPAQPAVPEAAVSERPPQAAVPEAAAPEAAVPEAAVPGITVAEETPTEIAATDQVVVSGGDGPDSADPADEPPEEDVDMSDLLVVIDLTDEVFVVDLRPRYHLADCQHLRDRETVPIPVNEARADGFTPCGLCGPDASLALAARQAGSSALNDPPV